MILEELRLSAQFKFLKQCVYLISHPLLQSLTGPDAYPFCGLAMLPKQILFINDAELCTASQIVCHTLVTGELATTPQRLMDVLDFPTYPAYQAAALNTVFVELQLVPPPNLGVAVVLNVVLLALLTGIGEKLADLQLIKQRPVVNATVSASANTRYKDKRRVD